MGMDASPVARPLRRDAERNRQRIVAAAAELFAERGLAATLDDVAVRAGVGVGTVYRRFPDKAHLVDALFEDRLVSNAWLVEQAATRPDAGAAFLETLETLAERLAADQALGEVMLGSTYRGGGLREPIDRLNVAMARLLGRAQREGAIRADLAPNDVPPLLVMLGSLAELGRPVQSDLWRRYLPLIVDAVRTPGGERTPLTHAALDDAQLERAMAAYCDRPARAGRPAGH